MNKYFFLVSSISFVLSYLAFTGFIWLITLLVILSYLPFFGIEFSPIFWY